MPNLAEINELQPLSTRIDPLLSELCGHITSASAEGVTSSVAIRASFIEALATVLTHGGDKATAAGLEKVQAIILGSLQATSGGASSSSSSSSGSGAGSLDVEDEHVRIAIGKCAGALAIYSEPMMVSDVLISILDACKPSNMGSRPQGVVCAAVVYLGSMTQCGGSKTTELREEVFAVINAAVADDRSPVRVAAFE
jgi:hypothetical protein